LIAGPATASDKNDVMAVLNQWVDGYNQGGDMKTAMATCADQASIVDSTPPHNWQGTGACSKWLSDFNASNKANEITDISASLGKLRHLDITGDRAYVVAPVNATYKVKGKPTRDAGALWTVALQKGASGWRITGWAYTAGREVEVKTDTGK
jgi:ketosteroid isomerase-like protein